MNKLFILTFFMSISCIFSQNNSMEESLYDFTVKDIYGEDFEFSDLKGKKIMIVNTASKCGLTPQYKGLENLYSKYKNDNFIIIGFPANNFLWQEPGSNEKIATFCEENYGVSFPMMSKISVRGSSMHPIYKFLTDKSKNGVISSSVSWNFQKYLINEDGTIHKVISPRTKPEDQKIIDWITSS
ncbi:MAG: glutathione peroxidase [Flavobacteriaceae bacterium]|nr:glutathione peroxidase [Flavobacteriaceae bacterium]